MVCKAPSLVRFCVGVDKECGILLHHLAFEWAENCKVIR